MIDLREKFDRWMSEYFEVEKTASGEPHTYRGVAKYDTRGLSLYLGESCVGPSQDFRAGEDVPARVRMRIQEIVEFWEPSKILEYRRTQDLRTSLGFGFRYYARHGNAPDGGPIDSWARSVLARISRRYRQSPTVPDGLRGLWSSVVPNTANEIRRRQIAGVQ